MKLHVATCALSAFASFAFSSATTLKEEKHQHSAVEVNVNNEKLVQQPQDTPSDDDGGRVLLHHPEETPQWPEDSDADTTRTSMQYLIEDNHNHRHLNLSLLPNEATSSAIGKGKVYSGPSNVAALRALHDVIAVATL